jgi:putative ABC transport system permease protein
MDQKLYRRYYLDDAVDVFRVYLKPGARPADVRARIVDSLSGEHRLFVLMNADVRNYIDRLMNQWFGLTYLQVLVAVAVAILGIINTLTVSISDRRRELGVLRAVGGLRSQIRGTIWMEALAIGAIGLVLGVATGALNLYYELQVIQHDLTGIPLAYRFPLAIAAMLVPVILLSAFASSILPAETAVRSSLVEALEYE